MKQQSPRRVIQYYYTRFLIAFLFYLLIFLGIRWISNYFHWNSWIINLLLVLLVIELLYLCIRPWLLWKYRHYQIESTNISTIKDFFFKKQEIVKFDRIQYVERKSGPLLRLFKLYGIVVVTAGHKIALPLLMYKSAEEVEKICIQKLEEVDADV
ncbi:PH domain-containing protein [Staphylococcus simulans]|uniref:PH domain-containing protein n=1 Tax=Staphylococcus simulans TaxID=1286 RepID=UPI001E354131|nr:PH domain-containing protein [Staphylococcus simulans]MCD8916154.1 PH domain-containing protein [Staphylococcus simulans]